MFNVIDTLLAFGSNWLLLLAIFMTYIIWIQIPAAYKAFSKKNAIFYTSKKKRKKLIRVSASIAFVLVVAIILDFSASDASTATSKMYCFAGSLVSALYYVIKELSRDTQKEIVEYREEKLRILRLPISYIQTNAFANSLRILLGIVILVPYATSVSRVSVTSTLCFLLLVYLLGYSIFDTGREFFERASRKRRFNGRLPRNTKVAESLRRRYVSGESSQHSVLISQLTTSKIARYSCELLLREVFKADDVKMLRKIYTARGQMLRLSVNETIMMNASECVKELIYGIGIHPTQYQMKKHPYRYRLKLVFDRQYTSTAEREIELRKCIEHNAYSVACVLIAAGWPLQSVRKMLPAESANDSPELLKFRRWVAVNQLEYDQNLQRSSIPKYAVHQPAEYLKIVSEADLETFLF